MPKDIYLEANKEGVQKKTPLDIYKDFKPVNSEAVPTEDPDEILKRENPLLYKAGKFLQKHPTLSKVVKKGAELADPLHKAMTYTNIPQVAGGALEGIGNTAISIGNLPLQLAGYLTDTNLRVPHLNFGQHMENPGLPYEASKIISPMLIGLGTVNKLQNIARPQGKLGILSDILRGAGTGYAMGENAEGERGAGALAGGIFGGLRGVSSPVVADRIVRDMNRLRGKYKESYNRLFKEAEENGINSSSKFHQPAKKIKKSTIFKEAEKSGVGHLSLPKLNTNAIINNSSPKFHGSIKKFTNSPTLENAHKAQSDMGKLATHIKKLEKNNALTSEHYNALEAALDAQKRIRGSIFTEFSKRGRPDLANRLFKEAQESSVGHLSLPKLNTKAIINNSSSKFHRSIKKFRRSPTLENAHKAQSDMGKLAAHIKKLEKNNALTSEQYSALKAALDAQKRIRGSISTELSKRGRPDLANRYRELTHGYAEEVIPYRGNKAIRRYAAGKLPAKDLTNKLYKDYEFEKSLGKVYPEIKANKLVNTVGKIGLYSAGIGGGHYAGYKGLEKIFGD